MGRPDRGRGGFRGRGGPGLSRGGGGPGPFRRSEGGGGPPGRNSFGGGGRGGGGPFRGSPARGRGGGGSGRGGVGGRGGSPRGGRRGGFGAPRTGGGMKGGKTVIVEPHRLEGVFVVKGKEDALATRNLIPSESVYGEKRVTIKPSASNSNTAAVTAPIEYRIWNPFRSKLAAAIMAGVENTHIKPGTRVLYLGAASGTTVSHVSDIVGPDGIVYAVEFSHRSGRDLLNVAKKRQNIVPIVDDARHPHKYSMICGIVDTIFADIAQPNQAQIVGQNAHKFLKNNGFAVISIKANCIDSTAEPEAVFAGEVNKLRDQQFKPIEQVTLEPYERDHAVVVAEYRGATAKKSKQTVAMKQEDE